MARVRVYDRQAWKAPMPADRPLPWVFLLGQRALLSAWPRRRPVVLTWHEGDVLASVVKVIQRAVDAGRLPSTPASWVYAGDEADGRVVAAHLGGDWLARRVHDHLIFRV